MIRLGKYLFITFLLLTVTNCGSLGGVEAGNPPDSTRSVIGVTSEDTTTTNLINTQFIEGAGCPVQKNDQHPHRIHA